MALTETDRERARQPRRRRHSAACGRSSPPPSPLKLPGQPVPRLGPRRTPGTTSARPAPRIPTRSGPGPRRRVIPAAGCRKYVDRAPRRRRQWRTSARPRTSTAGQSAISISRRADRRSAREPWAKPCKHLSPSHNPKDRRDGRPRHRTCRSRASRPGPHVQPGAPGDPVGSGGGSGPQGRRGDHPRLLRERHLPGRARGSPAAHIRSAPERRQDGPWPCLCSSFCPRPRFADRGSQG